MRKPEKNCPSKRRRETELNSSAAQARNTKKIRLQHEEEKCHHPCLMSSWEAGSIISKSEVKKVNDESEIYSVAETRSSLCHSENLGHDPININSKKENVYPFKRRNSRISFSKMKTRISVQEITNFFETKSSPRPPMPT